MLYNYVRELITKYTFIQKVTASKGKVYLWYYKDNDKEKGLISKRLPLRTNKEQLIRAIEKIKDDIGYYEQKKERDKIVNDSISNDKKPYFKII
jgi:hypothetical protein